MTPEQIEQMKRDREAGGFKYTWCLEGNFDESSEDPLGGWVSLNWKTEIGLFELGPVTGTREEICANARRIARVPTLEAEVLRLREIVQRTPDALNAAFNAGTEEREGGSVRRQAKALDLVETLRTDIRAALNGDAP